MIAGEEYKVSLDAFVGPMDLLLYLIRKEEINIYDIPIGRITDQYMEYLNLMKLFNLAIAGDFIVMAATLMLIKSRMLLPEEERVIDPDEEEEDPRWELVRQLVEYKKFKEAALHLQDRQLRQENVFTRTDHRGTIIESDPKQVIQDVSIFDLITAFHQALKNIKKGDIRQILAEKFTVAEKMESLSKEIQAGQQISFKKLLSGMTSRVEIVCTFLAILELMRLRRLRAQQDNRFGEIILIGSEV